MSTIFFIRIMVNYPAAKATGFSWSESINNIGYHTITGVEMKRYFLRVLIALDQLVNTLFGGYPNETLSGRAWRRGSIEGNTYWYQFHFLIDWLFSPFGERHCELSYIYCIHNIRTHGLYFPTASDASSKIRVKSSPSKYSVDHAETKSKAILPLDHSDYIDW